jgi:hypothetical protein
MLKRQYLLKIIKVPLLEIMIYIFPIAAIKVMAVMLHFQIISTSIRKNMILINQQGRHLLEIQLKIVFKLLNIKFFKLHS